MTEKHMTEQHMIKKHMTERFESSRLIIRSTKKADTEFCLSIWLDDEMGKYLSDPPRALAGQIYDEWQENIEIFEGCYYFVAVSKETGDRIGTCSLVPNEDLTVWDLGYTVHQDYWRMGYGTEIIESLMQMSRDMGGQKITAAVASENPGSNAVLRKLGFSVEKEGSFKKSGTDIVYEEYVYARGL